ncbi:unnamed protein product [Peronospora effusa]|nr:unnamed protein product [Peronospora effusa]
MRACHVQLLLAAAAITHAVKAKTTTSAAVSTTNSTIEFISTAGRDKGDGKMNVNVLVNEVLADEKTTVFAAGSPKSSEDSTYTTERDDSERAGNFGQGFGEGLSEMVGKLKDAVIPKMDKLFTKTEPKEYQALMKLAAKHSGDPASAMVVLKKKYNDKRIAELIVDAKMDPTHNGAALKLEEAQMEYWLNNHLSAGGGFELLGLNEAEGNLLARPLFQYWSTYVERFNTKHSEKVSAVDILTPKYYTDAALARLIVDAKKDTKSKSNAVKLGEEQLDNWLSKKYSADKVFRLLKLDKVEDGLLTHPVFNHWYTYFERINVEHNTKKKVVSFLEDKASNKGFLLKSYLKDEAEKANFETKSRVYELFVELKLERVEDGLFSNPLFIFWRTCLQKFRAAHPEEPQTSVFNYLRTLYGDKGLADLIIAERQVKKSAKFAIIVENELCATWVSNGKSLDDVFELLDLNRAGYKLLEDPSMKTFVTFTKTVNMNRKTHTETKEAAFEANEIFRGIKFASGTRGLLSTESEKALFQLWFTQDKKPNEVFKMFLGKKNLDKILKDEGNLFEIPLFVTYLKYAEAYSRTKRLARAEDYTKPVKDFEKRPWKTDPTTMVDYIDRKADVAFLLEGQFYDRMDKLGEMILSAKKLESESAKYAVQRVENDMFRFWSVNGGVTPDSLFASLKLNDKMTPAELFENPMFRWWIDYMDFFVKQLKPTDQSGNILMEVFKHQANLKWLKRARKNENTRELADKVWTDLINQHLTHDSSPEKVWKKLMLSPKSSDDMVVFERYLKVHTQRLKDAEKEMQVRDRVRTAEEEVKLKKVEQEMSKKTEDD